MVLWGYGDKGLGAVLNLTFNHHPPHYTLRQPLPSSKTPKAFLLNPAPSPTSDYTHTQTDTRRHTVARRKYLDILRRDDLTLEQIDTLRSFGVIPDEVPFVPFANTIEVVLKCVWKGQEFLNIWGVNREGAWDETAMDSYSTIASVWSDTYLKPQLSTTVAIAGVKLRDLSIEGGFTKEYNWDQQGTDTGNISGPADALRVRLTTGIGGKSGTGHKRFSGIVDGNSGDGIFSSACVTAWENVMSKWQLMHSGATLLPGVLSRRHNKAWRTTGLFVAITGFQVYAAMGTQVSRRDKAS